MARSSGSNANATTRSGTYRLAGSRERKNEVTMRDVAKAAGVSRMTVSRAMKSDSPIADETRQRILQIVRDMNFVPDQMAGSLSTRKTGFVAALLPSLNNLHHAQTVQSLTEELETVGLQILLGHTDYSVDREEKMVEMMLRRRPEAIVLSYDGHTERTRSLLRSADIPVVEIWEIPQEPIRHSVGFSNRDAVYEMTVQLIAQGYEKITFLGEKNDEWTRGAERRRGFVDAMGDNGLDADRLVRFGAPPLSIEVGAQAAPHVLVQFPDTTCILCVSDLPAFGVQSHLLSNGYRIPQDIAVVGFGNFEVSRFAAPSISTVVVDPEAIGREAAQLIIRLLDTPSAEGETPISIHVPTLPVSRQSS